MGTIAEKLTYLNTTKEKIRDSINLTGANIGTSDTFRSYASKLKLGYIDIINNGIDTLYNNFPKVSGIGSNLSLTPTYEAPMKLNEIQGDTLQDGTPTPSAPVPIQSVTGLQKVTISNSDNTDSNTYEVNLGKNLLNIPDGTYSNNGITAVSSNGIITLNGTATNTSFIVITLLKEIVAANQTLTISNNNQENISDNLTEARLLTTVGDYIPCSFKQINNSTTRTNLTGTYNRLQIRTSSGVSFNNFVIKPMLEKGTQATSYSPYFTPIELNKIGTYKDSIKKSSGKNLFDKSTITSGYINADGSITTNNSYVTSDYIPIDSTLSYSKTITNSPRIKLYDKDKNIISNESYSDISSFGNAGTYTIPYTNAKYIRFTIRIDSSGVDIDRVMFTKGNTIPETYEPYGKVWYIEKQIGKVVLDGTENGWSYNDVNAVFIIPDLVDYIRTGFIPYSNYYKGANISVYSQLNNNEISFLKSTSQNRILIKNTNYTGVTAFKTWLSTHNTEVLYVLATPTTTEITNTELIEDLETLYTAKSQEGTTNISITSEDLEMILNVSALKGEV